MAWTYNLRVYLITAVAITLIVFAVVFSVLRAVLPHATGYVDEVQRELSRQIGLPVSIASIDADMYWLIPRLKLLNVVIHDKDAGKELFHIDEAIFALSYLDSIINLSPMVGDISLVGTELFIKRQADKRWAVQGIDLSDKSSSEAPRELIEFVRKTNFSLLDSDIHWDDEAGKSEQMDFIGINVVKETFFGEHSLEIDMQLPDGYGDAFRLITKVSGDLGKLAEADWEVYMQGTSVNLSRWFEKFSIEGIPAIDGVVDGKVWLTMKNRQLSALSGDLSINAFQLSSIEPEQQQWQAERISTKFNWRDTKKGWRLDVRDLAMIKNGKQWEQRSDVVMLNNDITGMYISASYLRLHDFVGLAEIFVKGSAMPVLADVKNAKISGELYNLSLLLPVVEEAGPRIKLDFSDAGFTLADIDISVKGMDGVFSYGGGEATLEILTEAIEMDFGELFRRPVKADIAEGWVSAKQLNDGWHISSSDIHLLSMDIESNTRLDINARKDGAVIVDMQTDFRNAIGASVANYLPVPVMSAETVNWLDRAITDGLVKNGGFILRGDISKFPYAKHDGVMEVVFDASDLTLRFLPDWPELHDLSADVRFYNSSMSIDNGRATTYRGVLQQVSAYIPDLDKPQLSITGSVSAPAEDVQRYIWNSGLKSILGDAMNQFTASGGVLLDLALDIPLQAKNIAVKTRGELTFNNNKLHFPVMDYDLDQVSGKLSFTENDLKASGIKANFEKAPVLINIASLNTKSKAETAFYIRGDLPIDGLLKKFDWLPSGWLSGTSGWDIVVRLPHGNKEHTLLAEMQSSLEGVQIDLSDKLNKKRNKVMLVELGIKLLDDVLQLEVNSDDVLSLFATRDAGDTWDFVMDSAYIRGSGAFAEDLNKNSTVNLQLEHVDVLALFEQGSGSGKKVSLKPSRFPSLNVSAKSLIWKEWKFNAVKLETNWHAHGMLIHKLDFNSPSMSVTGKGSWLSTWRHDNESTFSFSVNSGDMGQALSALGITDRLARCEQTASVDLKWLAEPYNFSLNSVSGSAHVEMRDGEVRDVQPGAGGRLLGLFNVLKLGDRLMLNFGDVYREGFAFDSVVGDFEFQKGSVITNNIELKAAAADVRMLGTIGLEKQDYDLVMQVRPHSSAAAFTGGTLAGGPVVGTALVVVNKLLGLDKLAYDEYQVSGTWDEPQVKQISRRENNNE